MKYASILAFLLLYIPKFFSQTDSSLLYTYDSDYERTVLESKTSSYMELLMAVGDQASVPRTAKAQASFDDFMKELKASNILKMSEAKQMKTLHDKVHKAFLTRYQLIVPFYEIFETGTYNCVTATALFAMVLEELEIPYNIQEQPTHVYIMAYPDTKAISVEMTAVKDANYIIARKNLTNAVNAMLELQLTTREEIQLKGEAYVYNAYYNTNSLVDLYQLCGIQYFNESILAINEGKYELALSAICKAEKMYDKKKTRLLKSEILMNLMSTAKFDQLKDIAYLVGYTNVDKSDGKKVIQQYATFLNEQLIARGNKGIVDSSFAFIQKNVVDSVRSKELSALYYAGYSDYYAKAKNTKKQMDFAEKAYACTPTNAMLETWFVQSVIRHTVDKLEGDQMVRKFETLSTKYPALLKHNLFLAGRFYAYATASNDYFSEDDGENGNKYFDLALKTRTEMTDTEILDQDEVAWIFAEKGAYLFREERYTEAIKVMEEGLKLAPEDDTLLTRIEMVKSRMK